MAKIPANILNLACLVFVLLPLSMAQTPPDPEDTWPKEVDSGNTRIIVYQPQTDAWKKNRLQARSAVTLLHEGEKKPIYGIVTLSARTDVDKEDRMVALEDLQVTSAHFPAAAGRQKELEKVIREGLKQSPVSVSLDRLLADLAITNAAAPNESVPLNNTPPRIVFSDRPAVLIRIDGEPVYRPVKGTPYTRVLNTPALILFNAAAQRFYLDGQDRWMTASSLNGPWSLDPHPPADLDPLKARILDKEDKDPHDHSAGISAAPGGGVTPVVFVSTVPAELIQTGGAPQFTPIPGTQLVYATNTENDIFMDVKTQDYFTLLSGRWFQSRSLNGPWTWLSGDRLPRDFERIAPDSPKAAVLASIPGTEQAKEALIADQIPQTATVKRSEAHLNVTYDGQPRFQPIQGTNMEYAANSPDDVIQADGRFYAVHDAVWFVAASPFGPWVVADDIPAAIYSIPPSCPLYHDRYVYVYGSTPDVVYDGYTPGYLGAYPWDGVVMFGTGWDYPAWAGDFYFGWPWTWGFGLDYGYWGGGWFGRPIGGGWWYHNPGYMHRIYNEHWNPQWRPGDSQFYRNNVNVYNRWAPNTLAPRTRFANIPQRTVGRPMPGGDLYAGRDGQVYQHRQNGWFQHTAGGTWNRAPAARGLEMQRQSRALGQSRWTEFHSMRSSGFGRGGFSGARPGGSFGGFSGMPRSMSSGFGHMGGGRMGGFHR